MDELRNVVDTAREDIRLERMEHARDILNEARLSDTDDGDEVIGDQDDASE